MSSRGKSIHSGWPNSLPMKLRYDSPMGGVGWGWGGGGEVEGWKGFKLECVWDASVQGAPGEWRRR